MDTDIVVAIISGLVTVFVGLISAFFAYKGAIRGAREQIAHEKNQLISAQREQEEFSNLMIEKFILNELRLNFSQIDIPHINKNIVQESPFQFGFGRRFIYSEFERVKYELIKHKSETVKEIIDFYSMFNLIDYKGDLKDFTQLEYEEFKRIFYVGKRKYN